MVESHTDSKIVNTNMFHENWDLSVKRATSVLRLLEEKYNMPPEKMIAGGRSSYIPSV
jgi:chemotaxis protein MotB